MFATSRFTDLVAKPAQTDTWIKPQGWHGERRRGEWNIVAIDAGPSITNALLQLPAGGRVEALVEVVVDVDVDVLGDSDRTVAEETGDVFDAKPGLVQGPGGEHVAEAVERPVPAAI